MSVSKYPLAKALNARLDLNGKLSKKLLVNKKVSSIDKADRIEINNRIDTYITNVFKCKRGCNCSIDTKSIAVAGKKINQNSFVGYIGIK